MDNIDGSLNICWSKLLYLKIVDIFSTPLKHNANQQPTFQGVYIPMSCLVHLKDFDPTWQRYSFPNVMRLWNCY